MHFYQIKAHEKSIITHMAFSSLLLLICLPLLAILDTINCSGFNIREATIPEIQLAFSQNKLTSKQLVSFYLNQIETLNPVLRSVLEVNPDALVQAARADEERERSRANSSVLLGDLHGIPVLLKDSIGTKDKLNTTCGSFALLGEVPQDAGVVTRLRNAGAIILGKASQNEWYGLKSSKIPQGWCAKGGQAKNPYLESGDTCGSSSGSAIAVAANMVAVSLGSETDGSIICPADRNSIVGIKPTVGLTSRAGVVPISSRQDTIGPMCRTVSDAVYVLDAIVGFDPRDHNATKEAAEFIPTGGYKQFLKQDGLEGKRLGVVKYPFLKSYNDSAVVSSFNYHLKLLRKLGATLLENLEIPNIDLISDPLQSGEASVLLAEFKITVNQYFEELVKSPITSLADLIAFNDKHPVLENTEDYGQDLLIAADATDGLGEDEIKTLETLEKLSIEGFDELMKEHELDSLVTIGSGIATIIAIRGHPAISVPAGYDRKGMPYGISFSGLRGTEPKLIEIAYAFEQATLSRRPPFSNSCEAFEAI